MKRVLNVGGNSKEIPLPPEYLGFEHLLLDIDPLCNPDILLDARKLTDSPAGQFDAIYCSHNLEHYYRHDVPKVLSGFLHVLKPGGFAHVVVPDLIGLMRQVVYRNMDLEDHLYLSAVGPIAPIDVIYGYGRQIESSGTDFFAHKTGFSAQSLARAAIVAGFSQYVVTTDEKPEISLIAFKGQPDPAFLQLFRLRVGE